MAGTQILMRAAHPKPLPQTQEDLQLLQPLVPWWRGLPRTGHGLPLWSAELVHDLRPWLPSLLMVRFSPDSDRPRYTLYGTELVRFSGHDLTGHEIDSGSSPGFQQLAQSFLRSEASSRPLWSRVRVDLPRGQIVRYDRLLLPFACADGDRRVMGAIRFDTKLPRRWHREEFSLTIEQENLLA